jgi:hypothetical protein
VHAFRITRSDPANGNKPSIVFKWRRPSPTNNLPDPMTTGGLHVANGILYYNDGSDLIAVDALTGNVSGSTVYAPLWCSAGINGNVCNAGGITSTSYKPAPVVANGVLYYSTNEGALRAFAPDQFSPTTVATQPATSPATLSIDGTTTPYQGAWDHVLFGTTPTSPAILLADNRYQWGLGFDGWSTSDKTTALPTTKRLGMWTKAFPADGSEMAMVATASDGKVWELGRGRREVTKNITVKAAGSPSAYTRHDGYQTVVYRGTDNLIYEAHWISNDWWGVALPGQSGMTAVGDPIGQRRDSTDWVVYKCGTSKICELRLTASGWAGRSMTTAKPIKGTTLPAPMWNESSWHGSIFYTASDGIRALRDDSEPGFGTVTDVLVVADEAAASSPAPFVTYPYMFDQNILSNVVYRTNTATSSQIVEAVESGYGTNVWTRLVRRTADAGETFRDDPSAYVSPSPWLNTIAYRNTANTAFLLRWNGSSYTRSQIWP